MIRFHTHFPVDSSCIEIASPLSIGELKLRLQRVTTAQNSFIITDPNIRYLGQINSDFAQIRDVDASLRSLIPTYFIKFQTVDDFTIITITNDAYSKTSMVDGILKGLLIPFGIIFFVLGLIKYKDPVSLILGVAIGGLFISVPLLVNSKPLDKATLYKDKEIEKLRELFNGTIKYNPQ